ncbi:hypothetical protein AURDEDRAFT_115037 [Auricularia subglabra TFB-10046 SS5]|nr:hypothetical protein AURDEDRAFT_115037 [Auricularia subglabra TFB-10046 SS5]
MLLARLSFLLALTGAAWADAGLDPPGLQPLIAQGDSLLAAGQFSEAARAYSDAIELSPGQYLLYYKRATAYFSANRHAPALEDFDTVLSLTKESGSFDKAYLMKGKIFAREGRWPEARDALKSYTAKIKTDRNAGDLLFGVSEGEVASKKAVAAQAAKDWPACVEQATAALHTATHSVSLRQLRADCALASGDVEQAAADLTRLTHLAPPSTEHYLRLASLTYFLLPPSQQAQSTLKQCLHGDPDSKVCAAAHRRFKQFDKQFTKLQTLLDGSAWASTIKLVTAPENGLAAKFEAAMKAALEPLALPATIDPLRVSAKRHTIYTAACRAFVESQQIRKSEAWCTELLRMDEESTEGLIGRGELALIKEDWEDAVRAFEKAWEAQGRQGGELHQKLQRAQRLLKQSKAKDYYKVLGVSRDADQKTIKKAYRRAAMTAHPDKGGSEAKMAAVNEAYEVLSKPELRERFDNGEDPMDPMSQQGGHPFHQGGGHPFNMFFQQGGMPFGGGQTFHYQWAG